MPTTLPRLRQAVLAAAELEPVADQMRRALGLKEPHNDPGVGYFGLHNAVFAIGDQFLEVVSPVREDTAAGRLIEGRGGDCGYMLMFQVADLAAARERAAAAGVREVFQVELDDIAEVHLHPADMQGAIVALSAPIPETAWRWGGADSEQRAAPGELVGVTVSVSDPTTVAERWRTVIGGAAGVEFVQGDGGPVELRVAGLEQPAEIAGVSFQPAR